ncbi:ATP-binding protein [Streptomyces sp. BR123]|uniref:ATP-binding protein n=1 Tax=Streptomyces sp. BR123 TaxID=2749828 RepID=UPI0015C4A4F8|nr:ATP-binding protein [Streptomyces sp. BR123]NXY97947.1 ATP-binding protein [Streptomyces sp. BR123]
MTAEELVGATARAYLDQALSFLYDSAAERTRRRARPRPGEERERSDETLWRQVHARIAEQMQQDRRAGAGKGPDRFTAFRWETFRQLRADIGQGRLITTDRQSVLEALVRLGGPDHRALPLPLALALDEVAQELHRVPGRRAGDGGSRHRKLVDEVSERARRDMLLLGRGSADAPPVSLRDVYVRRGTEERMARIVQQQVLAGRPDQPVQLVVGEAGTGKSSLLWCLAELVEGRRAAPPREALRTRSPSGELRTGTGIRPVFLRAEQLLTPGEGDRLLESVERGLTPGRVVLLDTADLLLHAADGRTRLLRAVAACRQRGVPLVMTCRTRDSASLQDLLGRTPAEVAFHVGDFHGREELERALSTYCLHYLPDRPPAARAETVAALRDAAVRGLPIREVVARPLTLRMLFEVYAPQSPTPEIDAAGLYDRYWERRVREDARHGSAGDAGPVSADLSWPAQGLARLMLHDGVVALPVADAAERMAEANPEAGDADPLDELAQLDRRSVVAGTDGGGRETARAATVGFFHQTLFEYAAGRCLVRLAADKKQSYYRALGRHLAAHPDDFLRAVVAEQALVQGMRAQGRVREHAAELLGELLCSEDVDLQVIAVRSCALLPDDLYGSVRDRFHAYLRESPPPAMVREMLTVLPTREHTNPERVAEDLGLILEHHPRMKWRVLDLLCRFGRIDRGTSDAVRGLLHRLCEDPGGCVECVPDPQDAAPTGCGGRSCLWSWLVNLNANSAGSHGNQAVRLVDALAEHWSEWAAERLRQLLALAEHHRSALQALQCVAVVHRHAGDPDLDALFPVAAGIAQRLGTDRAVPPKDTADEEEDAPGGSGAWAARTPTEECQEAQAALDAYWFASSPGRTPQDVVRALAAEGKNPFDVARPRLRAVLEQVGTGLREAETGVPELLDETVGLCRGRDTVDDVAAFLLPPLLREPADAPGTRAAAEWCADRLDVLTPRRGGRVRPGSAGGDGAADGRAGGGRTASSAAALRFAVSGLARLAPARLAEIVRWPSKGGSWAETRTDDTFLALDGATRLLVPLAATGHARAVLGLERWRTLEGLRHAQLAQGRNAWPEFGDGRPYHGSRVRDRMSGLVQAALADHAPHAHALLPEVLRFRVPTADVPWLAALAKRTVEQPGRAAEPARALFARYGPDLADWCAELWFEGPCPDGNAKAAALRLWGDLVRLGAADRPLLARQAELAAKVRKGQWTTAAGVLRHWNGHDVSPIAAVGGEPGWQELDAALAAAGVPDGSAGEIARLRSFLRCRFAPLSAPQDVAEAVATVAAQLGVCTDTAAIHDTGAGFLAERLCAVDPGEAVAVALGVARRTAGSGVTDPHHVTRLGWKWQKPLTRMAVTADRADWLRLIAGLGDGPQSMLQKALDTAAARRRDEDVRADAARELAASPYRDAAMAGLRDAAVRYRRTPLEERLWPEVLKPA